MRVAPEIVLTNEERGELTKLVRSKLTSVRLAQRARIVLLAAKGQQSKEIAAALGIGRVQVSRWRERYAQTRLAGIERDLPRGAPPVTVDVARLVKLTTQSTPKAATHWSTRTMAAELGVSAASVSRHWRKNGLKPRTRCGFKPCLRQWRETLAALTPNSAAIVRVLQCVAALGVLWVVSFTRRATSTVTGGAPRGRSRSIPASRVWA